MKNNDFRIYRNGQLESTSSKEISAKTNTRYIIGNRHFTSNSTNPVTNGFWDGDVLEVLVIDKNISDQERAEILYYLSSKWGMRELGDSDNDELLDAFDTTPAGLVTQAKQVEFEITYEDEAGNQGDNITQTSDGTSVSIDTTSPIVTDYSIEVNEKSLSTS